jgi:hypothetical protein
MHDMVSMDAFFFINPVTNKRSLQMWWAKGILLQLLGWPVAAAVAVVVAVVVAAAVAAEKRYWIWHRRAVPEKRLLA